MKKVVYCIIIFATMVFMITTPVRAERFSVDDLEIPEVQVQEATPEEWDKLVEWCENHPEDRYSDEVKSIDQIAWLVVELKKSIDYAQKEYHNILDVNLGIGIWEKENNRKEAVEKTIEIISNMFQAKTGVNLRVEKTKEDPEDGYACYMFYTDVPEYWLHQVTKVGESALVQANYNEGKYFESAWSDGSGRFGKVGNQYVSSGDIVTILKVAYLNENNEVIEVVSENGAEIEGYRRRMLLAKKGETVLGWFYPENVVTE